MDEEDWNEKLQTKYKEKITAGERRLRKLSDTTGSLQSNIKEQEEQSKLSGHFLAESIRNLMLDKCKHVE